MKPLEISVDSHSIARRMLFGGMAYVLMRLRGLITLPIMTRLLGPVGMGAVSMIMATVNLVWPIMTLGINYGLPVKIVAVQSAAEVRRLYGSAVNFVGISTGVTLAVVLAFYHAGVGTQLIDQYAPYLLATVVYILSAVAKEFAILLPKVLQRTKTVALWELGIEYGGAVASIAVLFAGMGPQAVIWSLSVVTFLISALVLMGTFLEFGYYRGMDWGIIGSLLRTGLPVVPVSLSQWALQASDHFFLVFYRGSEVLGLYSVTYTVASPTLGVMAVLSYVYFPTMVTLFSRGRDQFERFFFLSVRLTTLVLGLWLVAMSALGRDIVVLLAGSDFQTAGWLLPLVVLAYMFLTLTSLYQQVPVVVMQRTVHMAYAYGFATAVNLVLNYFLIRRFGIWGAASATVVGYAVLFIFMVITTMRFLPARPLLVQTVIGWTPLTVCGPLAVWTAGNVSGLGARLLVTGGIVFLFLVVSWLFGAINASDLALVRSLKSKAK